MIGFAGRFVEEKGFDILLDAISKVIEKIHQAHFVFAGSQKMDYEPFFEICEKRVKKNRRHLTFLGLLKKGDLSYFYKNLDLFVIPSRSDCFTLTQIEAVLSGIPVGTTDIPGARVLVKKTGFGKLSAPENAVDFARQIIWVLENREQLLKNQSKAKQFLKDGAKNTFLPGP